MDYLQVIHKSKITKNRHWVMGGFYVSEISFVQLIGLYSGVNVLCIDVTFSCRICDKWVRRYFSSLLCAIC